MGAVTQEAGQLLSRAPSGEEPQQSQFLPPSDLPLCVFMLWHLSSLLPSALPVAPASSPDWGILFTVYQDMPCEGLLISGSDVSSGKPKPARPCEALVPPGALATLSSGLLALLSTPQRQEGQDLMA